MAKKEEVAEVLEIILDGLTAGESSAQELAELKRIMILQVLIWVSVLLFLRWVLYLLLMHYFVSFWILSETMFLDLW